MTPLRTDDVLVLGSALRPPEGSECDALLAWTYSLEPWLALELPLAVFRGGAMAGDDRIPAWKLLEAVRARQGRYAVFHDARRLYPPRPGEERLLHELAGVLVPLILPPRRFGDRPASFHPKLVVARYRDVDSGAALVRVVCMSRNLTRDGSLDVSVTLDGGSHEALASDDQRTRALAAALVHALDWVVRGTLDRRVSTLVRELAATLQSVRWTPPSPFDSVRFYPLGFGEGAVDPVVPTLEEDRSLTVSPFLTDDRLKRIGRGPSQDMLVSESAALAQLKSTTRAQFHCRRIKPAGMGSGGLHAKLYLLEGGARARWLVGSANATSAAFGGNAELLVELRGAVDEVGIDATLGGDGGMEALLLSFDERSVEREPDPDEHLEDAIAVLVAARYRAQTTNRESGSLDVLVDANGLEALPAGVSVTMAFPGDGASTPLAIGSTSTIAGVPRSSLVPFLELHVIGAEGRSKACLVGLELPEDLNNALRAEAWQRIEPSPLEKLRWLLEGLEDMGEGLSEDEREDAAGADGGAGLTTWVEQGLLETVLRLLRYDRLDPAPLDALERRVREELRAGLLVDARAVVEMWDALMAGRQR